MRCTSIRKKGAEEGEEHTQAARKEKDLYALVVVKQNKRWRRASLTLTLTQL